VGCWSCKGRMGCSRYRAHAQRRSLCIAQRGLSTEVFAAAAGPSCKQGGGLGVEVGREPGQHRRKAPYSKTQTQGPRREQIPRQTVQGGLLQGPRARTPRIERYTTTRRATCNRRETRGCTQCEPRVYITTAVTINREGPGCTVDRKPGHTTGQHRGHRK